MNIILCGMPMSGKTTVGKLLANKFNYEFIDTDILIEKAYFARTKNQLSCREIFKNQGEAFFRSLEKEQLSALVSLSSKIIAIGGGTLADEENAKLLKSLGYLVYLKVPLPTLLERIRWRGFPAYLDPNDPENSLRRIADKRTPIYEKLADLTIPADQLSPEEIVSQLIVNNNQLSLSNPPYQGNHHGQ